MVKILENILLSIFHERALEGQNWLKYSLKGIQGMVIKIEEFVGQKYNLEVIYKELPIKRNELTVCDSLFHLLTDK